MKKIGIIIAIAGVVITQASQVFAGYFNSNPIERCAVSVTTNLQKGSENDDVVRLQNLLVRGGYLYATPNGYFGYQTENAVRRFQRDNGLSASGVVGEATRNAVNERMCDSDIQAGVPSYETYGSMYTSSSMTTRVAAEDPFVQVVSAPTTPLPTLQGNPQVVQVVQPNSSTPLSPVTPFNTIPSTSLSHFSQTGSNANSIVSSGIIYNPSMGYTYGVVPASGSVTVTSPVANVAYNEGDSVNVNWYTSNLTPATFSILLENTASGQSHVVGTTQSNSLSFTLTKEILDVVCAGSCNYGNQNTYKIIVSIPVKDIAGAVSNLRAAVQPVTIKRQFAYGGQVSITTSKSPVNSGEIFKLYINIPRGASWDSVLAGNYSIKVKATCPAGVTATIAGTQCGTDFVIPFAPVYFQQEIPTIITNTSWYKQNVAYDLTVVNLAGQVIGTSQVNVIANGAPFGW
ncbi:MAG: peptidoglycan-binding protein [Candidatus Pacebacteria bacterium]|nr:peptidoglycan-binding protein [Candidatus Paceibacterota bacterium]